jgi:hypothetical protein
MKTHTFTLKRAFLGPVVQRLRTLTLGVWKLSTNNKMYYCADVRTIPYALLLKNLMKEFGEDDPDPLAFITTNEFDFEKRIAVSDLNIIFFEGDQLSFSGNIVDITTERHTAMIPGTAQITKIRDLQEHERATVAVFEAASSIDRGDKFEQFLQTGSI